MSNTKHCTFCESSEHTQFYCHRKPRNTLSQTKPMNKVGKVTQQWFNLRREWIAKYGSEDHHCHYCNVLLSDNQFLIDDGLAMKLTLDHLVPRSRKPSKRFQFSNLVPACLPCNTDKSSRSHNEFVHVCYSALPYRIIGTRNSPNTLAGEF